MKIRDVLTPSMALFRKPPSTPLVQLMRSDDSDTCRDIVASGLLTLEQMGHAAERYQLGRSRSGATVFWMIDEQGVLRDGHVGDAWASALMKATGQLPEWWNPSHCFFGQHLISEEGGGWKVEGDMFSRRSAISAVSARNSARGIGIVESERSAVILSELYPSLLWLANSYPANLTEQHFQPFQGHAVTLFPRTDPFGNTYTAYLELADQVHRSLGLDIRVSPILEDHATPEQKQRQIDIVDFYFESEF